MGHRKAWVPATAVACAALITAVSLTNAAPAAADTSATVVLMANQPIHAATAGTGSNMTSLITSKCHEVDTDPNDDQSCGSAYGALPEADDAAHWNSLLGYADFLGEDWIRLQLEQHQYEPQQGSFTWDSPNMQAVYRTAQWAKDHDVDILLQEVWQANEWNRIPGSFDVAHSAPRDLSAWASGYATMVNHLVNVKGYTNIKMVNISNEPMNWWGWWRGRDIAEGYQAARAALDDKGITLPLVGPEYNTNNKSAESWNASKPYLGAFEGHHYPDPGSDGDPYAYRPPVVGSVPVLWGEYGSANAGSYTDNVKFARWMIGGMNNGVDGTARWQYTNQNDIDGDFSLVNTWDTVNKKMLDTYSPHPDAYYLHAMISRYTSKYATAHAVSTTDSSIVPSLLKSPNGNYTVLAANISTADDADVTFRIQGLDTTRTLYRYRITEADKGKSTVALAPSATFTVSPGSPAFTDTMAKHSVYAYSTYNLAASDEGIVGDGAFTPVRTAHPLPDNDTVLEENNPAISYSGGWTSESGADYSGSSLRYTNTGGAAFEFTFTGTNVRLYGKQDNGSALASVYIDNQFAGYANNYAPLPMNRMMTYDSGPLPAGRHSVKVVVEGAQTVTGQGTYINVDAVGYSGDGAGEGPALINAGFESGGTATQTPTGWTEWGDATAAYTENKGAAYEGSYNLSHYSAGAYEVSTYQTVTGLANGLYTVRARVQSSGGQQVAAMGAKNYGGPELSTAIPPRTSWQPVTLSGVAVTDGRCEVSFYSKASAGQWLIVDAVEFFQQ